MEYTVTIEEQISEFRTYKINADSAEQAAREASAMWLDAGDEGDSKSVNVEERSYSVYGGEETEEFGVEIEE